MSRPHIFITRRIPDPGLEILQASEARVTICQEDEEQGVSREELLDGVKSCDVLLSLLTEPVDREVLAYENLLGVANMAVGFNNIDVDAATELGVPVSNTPGVLTDTTADLTWTLILAVARRVPEAHNYMVAGRYKLWGPNLFLGGDVSPGGSGRRKVLGIVGYGRIGQAVAKRARGFEMEVLAYDPYNREGVESSDFASWAELSELLAISDFVTLHPLLTEETHHLIGEAELQSMKSTAYLINASRGPVVEEKALVRALDEGWIAGAALDVYEEEPAMAEGLAELANVVLLPQIASASTDTRGKMAASAATNALAHLRRERAPNIVNPEVYDTEPYRRRAGG
ncbi:MAG: D-glycerate dehydrogenase [Thermoanaerobaculia bacterium]